MGTRANGAEARGQKEERAGQKARELALRHRQGRIGWGAKVWIRSDQVKANPSPTINPYPQGEISTPSGKGNEEVGVKELNLQTPAGSEEREARCGRLRGGAAGGRGGMCLWCQDMDETARVSEIQVRP